MKQRLDETLAQFFVKYIASHAMMGIIISGSLFLATLIWLFASN